MYSFSSFFNRFQNLNQAKSDVAEAKIESSSARTTATSDKTAISQGIFNPESLRSVGISDKFFASFKTDPTTVNNHVKKLMSGPLDHTQTNAYQRAFAGYSTGSIFSGAVSRLGSLTSLFDSAIQNPFGVNREA
jgi:hypothetical protein